MQRPRDADLFEDFLSSGSGGGGGGSSTKDALANGSSGTGTGTTSTSNIGIGGGAGGGGGGGGGRQLPDDDIYVPPQHQPPNPEDEDDVVPDQHAAFGIQRATQRSREPAWRDLDLASLMRRGPSASAAPGRGLAGVGGGGVGGGGGGGGGYKGMPR
ncbi:Apc13p protein-domain-containing protein [Xylaria palmicola]|nr:Apc13p protein-domain-containing protein [Xylaria palmicola]